MTTIKELEEALTRTKMSISVEEFERHAVVCREAAQTMLELMKARELATGGEWEVGLYSLSVQAEYEQDGKKWYMKILDIRGWGHLTGRGGRGLDRDEAEKIQESNAQFIATAANLTREK